MDGLHNYAAPLVGDADFCRILVENYPGKTFRYVHGSDMVCKLPTGWGYQHFPLERFITSFPRLNGPVSRYKTQLFSSVPQSFTSLRSCLGSYQNSYLEAI